MSNDQQSKVHGLLNPHPRQFHPETINEIGHGGEVVRQHVVPATITHDVQVPSNAPRPPMSTLAKRLSETTTAALREIAGKSLQQGAGLMADLCFAVIKMREQSVSTHEILKKITYVDRNSTPALL